MKKFLLTGMMAVAMLSAYAADETYNFFDPADCDAEGWLWLDSAEKIAKYFGPDKKIKPFDAPYEVEDPIFPGTFIYPETIADPTVEGYNTQGVKGGEGSKTGGIILPLEISGELNGLGGGIVVQMPDCALFELYLSQECPNISIRVQGAWSRTDAYACKEIHTFMAAYWWWDEDDFVSTEYAAYANNLQDLTYDWTSIENPDPAYEKFSLYGAKGNPRTAFIANYSNECETIIQGIRIKTFTNESGASVEGINSDAQISINGKSIVLSAPAEIEVYDAAGVKVASANAAELDCSALKGVYIVKAAGKTLKAIF